MRKLIFFVSILSILLLIISCGGSEEGNVSSTEFEGASTEFEGARAFSFEAEIDSETLSQEGGLRIRESFFEIRDEFYKLENNDDLNAFNETLTSNEQLVLPDLGEYIYFLIKAPRCPDYYDYSNSTYSNNILTINFDHFHENDVSCMAVEEELFLIFKALKIS